MIKKIKLGYVTRDACGRVWIPWLNENLTVSVVRIETLSKYVTRGNSAIYQYKSMKELRNACQFDGDVIMDEIEHDVNGPVTEFKTGRLYINPHKPGFYVLIEHTNTAELFPVRQVSKHAGSLTGYTAETKDKLAKKYGNKFSEVKIRD